jgi:hypothetical protein
VAAPRPPRPAPSLIINPSLGDDPNYWMALTHQADAKSISKKVKRMLLDLNLESAARPPVRKQGQPASACFAAGVPALGAAACR